MENILNTIREALCYSIHRIIPLSSGFTSIEITTQVFYALVLFGIVCSFGVMFFMSLIFLAAMYVNFYSFWYKVNAPCDDAAWDEIRSTMAAGTYKLGRLWHGYEVIGSENIPKTGPALFVFYHGPFPSDLFYFRAFVLHKKYRFVRFVAEKLLFKIPGFRLALDVSGSICTYEESLTVLKAGHLLGVAPGGAKESQFGDDSYGLLWGNRKGFARLAVEAKVPIIPCFTQNCREAFNVIGLPRSYLRTFYEKTKIPVAYPYGGFPVKMRTYIGEPIPYDPKRTYQELAEMTVQAVEGLIQKYQRIPPSIPRALLDRFSETLEEKTM